MRFLFDQSTDRRLAMYLKELGHDVTVVALDYPPSLPDEQVLGIALQEQRILVTEDRDFGELIFRRHLPAQAAKNAVRGVRDSPHQPSPAPQDAGKPVEVHHLFLDLTA